MEQIQEASHERWLSVDEIAQHLGVSKVSIYRWVEAGEMPAHKVGRQWKFKITEVDAWVCRGEASDQFATLKKNSNHGEEKMI